MVNDNLYAHFHPDERPFVDKASDWVQRAADHTVKVTDFLDPRQAFILESLVNREPDVNIRFDGGYEGAERKRAVIVPDYRDPEDEDIHLQVLEISSDDTRFSELEHGDFLGALLGLGIKRDKIGDLHVHSSKCHCLVAGEMIGFVDTELRHVHRVHVLTDIVPLSRLEVAKVSLEEMSLSVASLRLDGIVSDVCRLSRAKVLAPIQNGRCKVNWKVVEDPSKPLQEGDVVSFQGFGRFKVLEVEGVTKKGRIRVKIGKYI
ncbi:YlmH family RNA-binding protein [Paenibacillus sp. y28]|uniref:YlmH family RNA-binding protein n=1 Tax=Paenibacillus sp. y28 TaxID=3129110 RepID=UPI003016D14F